MTIRRLPGIGLRFGWQDYDDQWNRTGVDANWAWIDAILSGAVDDILPEVPFGTPDEGKLYIIGPGAGADSNRLALRVIRINADDTETAYWDFLDPKEGMELYVRAKDTTYRFTGGAWVPSRSASLSFFIGVPLASGQLIAKTHSPVKMDIPMDAAASFATSEQAPDADYVITIRKNGTSVGTIRFLSGTTTGAIQLNATIALVAGDALSFVAPADVDENFIGLSVTMTGVRKEQ